METINDRVKILRKKLELTLEKFGEKLGVGKNAISRIETKKNGVTDQMKKSICREYGVNPDWLENGTGDMFIIPEDDTAALVSELLEEPEDEFYQMILEVVRTYKQLSPDSRDVLQKFGKQYLENMKNRKET